MCYIDGYENPPSVFERKLVRARKAHRCCECLREIQRGKLYWRIFGVWDGEAQSYKVCERCERVRSMIEDWPASVVPFGDLRCCLREFNLEKRAAH